MKRVIVRVQRLLVASMIMVSGLLGAAAMLPAQPVSAARCSTEFLGFPTWYRGVVDTSTCDIKPPSNDKSGAGISRFVWRIVLNIIEIVLRVIGFLSVGYVIYGGYRYLISTGQPDKVTAAKQTIKNAIIGLVVSFFSVVIVTLVANNI